MQGIALQEMEDLKCKERKKLPATNLSRKSLTSLSWRVNGKTEPTAGITWQKLWSDAVMARDAVRGKREVKKFS